MLIAISLLCLVAGIFIGSKAFRKATEASFRRVTLGLLAAISIVGLARLTFA